MYTEELQHEGRFQFIDVDGRTIYTSLGDIFMFISHPEPIGHMADASLEIKFTNGETIYVKDIQAMAVTTFCNQHFQNVMREQQESAERGI
jgi:hypothetical protein